MKMRKAFVLAVSVAIVGLSQAGAEEGDLVQDTVEVAEQRKETPDIQSDVKPGLYEVVCKRKQTTGARLGGRRECKTRL